jgi:hypothetical protein
MACAQIPFQSVQALLFLGHFSVVEECVASDSVDSGADLCVSAMPDLASGRLFSRVVMRVIAIANNSVQ